MAFLVQQPILEKTFSHLRCCGRGQRECQVLWTSPWASPDEITGVIHPRHRAHAGGFVVDTEWLNDLWLDLADKGDGIRVQVHTHPGSAFHSAVDDEFPVIHTPGFLSLVIPYFAERHVGLLGAFLAEIGADGRFHEVPIDSRLNLV